MKLTETENAVIFSYLMAENNGKIVFLVDSEAPDSTDYSPPGQVFEEADSQFWYPLTTGKTVLTRPTSDRWGNWISALVPVRNPSSNEIIAVFGIDYDSSDWYANIWEKMVPDFIIAGALILIVVALLHARDHYHLERKLRKKLVFNELLYRSVFSQAPIGIAIGDNEEFVVSPTSGFMNINPKYQEILGRGSEELSTLKWTEITHPEDIDKDMELFEKMKKGEIDNYTLEKRFYKPDGSIVWVKMMISRLEVDEDKRSTHLCIMEEITDQKTISDALKESERSKTLFLSKIPGYDLKTGG